MHQFSPLFHIPVFSLYSTLFFFVLLWKHHFIDLHVFMHNKDIYSTSLDIHFLKEVEHIAYLYHRAIKFHYDFWFSICHLCFPLEGETYQERMESLYAQGLVDSALSRHTTYTIKFFFLINELRQTTQKVFWCIQVLA